MERASPPSSLPARPVAAGDQLITDGTEPQPPPAETTPVGDDTMQCRNKRQQS